MKQPLCPYCRTEMIFYAHQPIQLGKTGWVLGDLPNLVAGAMKTDIFVCPDCRRIEFFLAEEEELEENRTLPQVTCPKCGTTYDFDTPYCPRCKKETVL